MLYHETKHTQSYLKNGDGMELRPFVMYNGNHVLILTLDSVSPIYMCDLFELDVIYWVIYLMSELASSDILIQLMSEL